LAGLAMASCGLSTSRASVATTAGPADIELAVDDLAGIVVGWARGALGAGGKWHDFDHVRRQISPEGSATGSGLVCGAVRHMSGGADASSWRSASWWRRCAG